MLFSHAQCHIPITPAGFRAILDICFDANPFNTGNGFTWNSAPNPLVCKPTADQTAFQRLGVPEVSFPFPYLPSLYRALMKDAA